MDNLNKLLINIGKLNNLTDVSEYEHYKRQLIDIKTAFNTLTPDIHFCVKIAPSNPSDDEMDYDFISDQIIRINDNHFNVEHLIKYDKNNNHILYSYVSPFLLNLFNGNNICLILTGQSGTGKSHSLFGNKSIHGIVHQLSKDIFLHKKNMNEINTPSRIFVQCVEFLTDVNDLLGELFESRNARIDKKFKRIKNFVHHRHISMQNESCSNPHNNRFAYLEIDNIDDLLDTLKKANKLRKISATKQNKTSSRLHLLIRIDILIKDKLFTHTLIQ